MKILFIGAGGALGKFILEEFSKEAEFEIFVMQRSEINFQKNNNIKFITIGNFIKSNYLLNDIMFDCVIYMAGYWRGKTLDIDSFNHNYYPFVNILKVLNKNFKKIIYFSSSAVYQNGEGYENNEIKILPNSSYGIAKLLAENYLINYSLINNHNYTILRPFHVVSPIEKYLLGKSHVVTDFIYKVKNYGDIPRDNLNTKKMKSTYVPFTWVGDLINVLRFTICDSNITSNNIYNIGSRYSYNIYDLSLMILDLYFNNRNISKKNYIFNNFFDKSFNDMGFYSETPLDYQIETCWNYNES